MKKSRPSASAAVMRTTAMTLTATLERGVGSGGTLEICHAQPNQSRSLTTHCIYERKELGVRGWGLARRWKPILRQVLPSRVTSLDQADPPGARPGLDLLFARD